MKDQAYHIFNNLKEDQSIIIDKFAKNNPNMFRSYAIDYINDFGGLIFNDDYSIVTKCKSRLEVSKMMGFSITINFNRS